ncbi:MAG: hypothetical protein LBH55_03920 [Mycoplasmataceae bacterium]|nr:hypothetical protein [Mycoplasmataceae bacterium]
MKKGIKLFANLLLATAIATTIPLTLTNCFKKKEISYMFNFTFNSDQNNNNHTIEAIEDYLNEHAITPSFNSFSVDANYIDTNGHEISIQKNGSPLISNVYNVSDIVTQDGTTGNIYDFNGSSEIRSDGKEYEYDEASHAIVEVIETIDTNKWNPYNYDVESSYLEAKSNDAKDLLFNESFLQLYINSLVNTYKNDVIQEKVIFSSEYNAEEKILNSMYIGFTNADNTLMLKNVINIKTSNTRLSAITEYLKVIYSPDEITFEREIWLNDSLFIKIHKHPILKQNDTWSVQWQKNNSSYFVENGDFGFELAYTDWDNVKALFVPTIPALQS